VNAPPPRGFDPAPPPPRDVLRARRERLIDRIGAGVAVIGAAPELVRSRDAEVPYRPNPDLFYLTGLTEPEAVAVLSPHDPAHRFTLFVRPRDPEREAWSGPRVGVEDAASVFGADAAYPIGELAERLPGLLRPADRIVYSPGSSSEMDGRVIDVLRAARRSRARSGEGPTGTEDLAVHLDPLRRIKGPEEIAAMRVAAEISVAAHLAAMAAARVGAGEWEVQAELDGTMRRLGATGPAFPSIVAAGRNATVLHYSSNDRRIGRDELLLIDAAAEWGMYCSDITRTLPASGAFTPAQRELYEIVEAAEAAGVAAVRPGAPFSGIHDAAVEVLVDGMLRVGLLRGTDRAEAISSGAFRRFYMHQTSHWLGLDVHDVGLYREAGESVPLEAGMVLTVEPGLYIPADADDVPERFRGIGIRLEDSVLVTATGRDVLTAALPIRAAEVQAMVGG
jgi:Xaa-Pro aminopeptidase